MEIALSGFMDSCSLRRRWEINGARKNARERRRHACPPCTRPFFLAPIYFLAPATQARTPGESNFCLLLIFLGKDPSCDSFRDHEWICIHCWLFMWVTSGNSGKAYSGNVKRFNRDEFKAGGWHQWSASNHAQGFGSKGHLNYRQRSSDHICFSPTGFTIFVPGLA